MLTFSLPHELSIKFGVQLDRTLTPTLNLIKLNKLMFFLFPLYLPRTMKYFVNPFSGRLYTLVEIMFHVYD